MAYLEVNGRRVWHEVRGDGDALVLLHGAFAGASSFGAQIPAFVDAGFRMYAPERRGHVHTPDVDGPHTFDVMAEDTIAYLERAVGSSAHLVGWSDGAVVALLVARRRPDLVRRIVLIGQYYNSSGRIPDSPIEKLIAGPEAIGFLRQEYDQVSPDGPEHFQAVYDKTITRVRTEPELDLADFGAITAPTLVLQGDRDEVTVEHSTAVARALADGRLAVLPGTHALPVEAPELVNALIVTFLRDALAVPFWDLPAS